MSLSVGIVGLPNVGKSTLFNALVKGHQAKVSNFPFCTIEPNIGVVEVPDPRLLELYNIIVGNLNSQLPISKQSPISNNSNSKPMNQSTNQPINHLPKIVPAIIKFIDVAGLVKNAHKGEGLGNQFLGHIRECEAICLVLRCFEDPNVAHFSGKIDPKEDLEIIKTELDLADLQMEEKIKNKISKIKNTNEIFKNFKDIPMIYVANVSEKDASLSSEAIIDKFNLKSKILNPKSLIPISAKIEQDLCELSPEEQKEYLESLGLKSSGLDRLIQTAYKTLNLITFYTLKPDQVQAWPIPTGTKAPEAAGKIHTDFAKGFIAAEVVGYDDFIQAGGWQNAKNQGLLRTEGRDYIVQDDDVIEFRFNV